MPLMTTNEILKSANISRATLYRLIDEGLPYTTVGTRKKLFDDDQVRDFIRNRRNELSNDLVIGREYTNEEIVKIFRCGNMGGMRKSNTKNVLVLISFHDKADRLYEDYWKDDILYYTGMGQTGDQDLNFAQNKTLHESSQTGVLVYLFEMFNDQRYRYRGIVELAGEPFQENEKDINGDMRKVWKFPLKLVAANDYIEEDFFDKKAEKDARMVSRMPRSAIVSKAREIDRVVSEVTTTTKTYVRNPIIAQYAKDRARGICELCGEPAPFEVGGIPYLESHHLQFVSEGGKDSIDNIAALCPNCHRRMHALRDPKDLNKLKKAVEDHNWWAAAEDREYGEYNTRRLITCPHCGEVNRIDIADYAIAGEGERGRILFEVQHEEHECDYCGERFMLNGIIEFDEGGNVETDSVAVEKSRNDYTTD